MDKKAILEEQGNPWVIVFGPRDKPDLVWDMGRSDRHGNKLPWSTYNEDYAKFMAKQHHRGQHMRMKEAIDFFSKEVGKGWTATN
jgi:hypothetical protein